MIIKVDSYSAYSTFATVSLRCPSCRQIGTFESFNVPDYNASSEEGRYMVGQRRCPNTQCHAHLFFVLDPKTDQVVASYPIERLDFDSSAVPSVIASAFEEAITCHANNCYIASAIMVRKTLELICHDRGASGKNLKDRIQALKSKVILPPELFDALDELRLLGNDAAHYESKDFVEVGEVELELAIDFTKEILKAVYQYAALLSRLQAHKRNRE